MYYKIVGQFGSDAGDKWEEYLKWRGLNLASFDSVDGILRPDLFEPVSGDDWQNCVGGQYKSNMITNLEYAKRIFEGIDNSLLVGVEIELMEDYVPKPGILGYDIIDSYCDVSLVTNCGTEDKDLIDKYVMPNGLIGNKVHAFHVRNMLRETYPEDSHAGACEVWAVYEVGE